MILYFRLKVKEESERKRNHYILFFTIKKIEESRFLTSRPKRKKNFLKIKNKNMYTVFLRTLKTNIIHGTGKKKCMRKILRNPPDALKEIHIKEY